MKRWRAIGSLALIGAIAGVVLPAQGVLAQTAQWGWVVARQPKTYQYTPAPVDRGNSSGGVNRVQRDGRGSYSVFMPGVAAPGARFGVAHVSAMSSSRRACMVERWEPWEPGSAEEYIQVDCWNLSGALSDSRFTVNFFQGFEVSGHFAYAWAQDDNGMGTSDANSSFAYDSEGGTITVDHTGTGHYQVRLPNLAAHHGVVLVSATRFPAATCRFSSKVLSGPDVLVGVTCRNLAGSLKNTMFTITYLSGTGLKGPGFGHQAYVFAKQPTTTSYQPAAADRYSTSGQVPTVKRTGTGKYVVTLPGQKDGGAAQVTAETGGAARCVVNYIRDTSAPAQIGVGCYLGDGIGTDIPFTMEWAR